LTTLNNGSNYHCTYLKDEVLHEGKCLKMNRINYLDPDGKERTWEAIERTTRTQGSDTDAVAAIAIYRRLLHYDIIVLVRQYRPALNAYTIEFPAGLMESGESVDDAAIRELKEETGWNGEVAHYSTRLAVDPGCSSSTVRYATVKINGDSIENSNARQQLPEGEFVDLIMLPFNDIHASLEKLTGDGHIIDSRVEAFAIGLQMGLKFAKDAEIDQRAQNQASLPLDGSTVRTGLGTKQVT